MDRVRLPCLQDLRLDLFLKPAHDVLVLELLDVGLLALDVCVGERCLLLRAALIEILEPAQALERKVEVQKEERVREVDVGEASVEPRLEVDGQIEVVEGVGVALLDQRQQVGLLQAHRYVLYHHRGQRLRAVQNRVKVNLVVEWARCHSRRRAVERLLAGINLGVGR